MRKVIVLSLLLAAGAPLLAHHSFASYYHEEQRITIEGEVIEFAYRAPHAWVYLTVVDAHGTAQRYSAEWANPNRLQRDGISPDTLKAGDRVVIAGSPGRTADENKVHLKRIDRAADGWRWPADGVPSGRRRN